jgi:phosphoserine aminotransferase
MVISKPVVRPDNPRFSSGPCSKPPAWDLGALGQEALGRSHRSIVGKSKLKKAIELNVKIYDENEYESILKNPSQYI